MNNRDDGRIGSELGRGGLATLGAALAVFGDEADRMTEDLAAEILERQLDAALLVIAQSRIAAREHPVAADNDWRAGLDANFVGLRRSDARPRQTGHHQSRKQSRTLLKKNQ